MSSLKERRDARDGLKTLATGGRPLTAAIDLGASKVACFIMKPEGVNRSERTLAVAGVGYVQSRGVRAAPSSTWRRPPTPSARRSSAPRPWPASASPP
jgi:cell division protein FtsA